VIFFFRRVAQDVPYFFLHAAPMTRGTSFQARFQVPRDELAYKSVSRMSLSTPKCPRWPKTASRKPQWLDSATALERNDE
jgi:hypothetical protein